MTKICVASGMSVAAGIYRLCDNTLCSGTKVEDRHIVTYVPLRVSAHGIMQFKSLLEGDGTGDDLGV